jgi:hypothetical protein
MDDGLVAVSCTLAALAGVCFVSGLAILSGGRVKQHGQTRVSNNNVRRVLGH